MSKEDRFGGVKSKRLRHAFATQEIESNPMTASEIRMFRRMEVKGWSPDRQTKFVVGNITREQRQQKNSSRQLEGAGREYS